jgi:hypothetical protein
MPYFSWSVRDEHLSVLSDGAIIMGRCAAPPWAPATTNQPDSPATALWVPYLFLFPRHFSHHRGYDDSKF